MTALDLPTRCRSLRILVIEDEALIAMLVEDALTLHEHEVVAVASTVQEAIAAATAQPVDLALCDVKLADGDSGIDAAEALAAAGIPCLYLSGNCPDRSTHPLIIGCLAKPFYTAALGRAVATAHAVVSGETPAEIPAGMSLY